MSTVTATPEAAAAAPPEVFGAFARFAGPAELLEAARQVRDAGYRVFDTYSPFPVHGIDEAMGLPRSKLPWIVLTGALTGTSIAFFGQLYLNVVFYPIIIAGKPFDSLPPTVPICFELTILLGAFSAVFGMLFLNGLPRLYHPAWKYAEFARASDDGFFVAIEARDPRFHAQDTVAFLQKLGGSKVALVEA